jgi:hypothetical protein
MPAKTGRYEQHLIELFVSSYQNGAWAGSKIERLDEKNDGAIEALITHANGETIAIEHTLIEPFVGDKSDYAMFEPAFLQIENDTTLAVPNTALTVYVPVGILNGQNPTMRRGIVESIHSWIATNRSDIRDGKHRYPCDLPGCLQIELTVDRNKLGAERSHPGVVRIRRQQVTNDLDLVVEKALRKKLPKLVNTKADRHLLFLERDQFTFFPDLIFNEVERQRPIFPLLEKVDEIWHVETIFYPSEGAVYFELREGNRVVTSFTSPS